MSVFYLEFSECEVIRGNPSPLIRWFKDEAPVSLSNRLFLTRGGQRLKIKPITLADAGRYRCHVENDAGNARKEFSVEVVVKAKISKRKNIKKT